MSADDEGQTHGSPRQALGLRLREARQARGLTVAALGLAVGTTGAYVGKIERGERRPSPGTLRALVAALGGSEAERAELLDQLMTLGRSTGQLAAERPPPARRQRRRADATRHNDAVRSAAIARGDWATANAAADWTLAELGILSAGMSTAELWESIKQDPAAEAELLAALEAHAREGDAVLKEMLAELANPARQAELRALLDELTGPAAQAESWALLDELTGPAAQAESRALLDELTNLQASPHHEDE